MPDEKITFRTAVGEHSLNMASIRNMSDDEFLCMADGHEDAVAQELVERLHRRMECESDDRTLVDRCIANDIGGR